MKTNKKYRSRGKYKNMFHLVGMIAFSCYFFFLAFFSYGKLNEADIIKIETTVHNVESHNSYRKAWLIFSSSDGKKFYCRTDELELNTGKSLSTYLTKEYGGEELLISFTKRKDILPFNSILYYDCERVVSIECNGETIVSLEDYNKSNLGFFVGFIIVAIICLLYALFISVMQHKTIRGRFR